ncbi:hypothetical protein COCNU_13G007040 [Cocos nucifera]|uniref:Uncharacterized protein n=1 Tax=Cocos nucifera TaxID=13894 RepID=A0A8K0NBF5_COCNU|nr:hypothetical protein COCNU_13G007040 [Cocos nucifera]
MEKQLLQLLAVGPVDLESLAQASKGSATEMPGNHQTLNTIQFILEKDDLEQIMREFGIPKGMILGVPSISGLIFFWKELIGTDPPKEKKKKENKRRIILSLSPKAIMIKTGIMEATTIEASTVEAGSVDEAHRQTSTNLAIIDWKPPGFESEVVLGSEMVATSGSFKPIRIADSFDFFDQGFQSYCLIFHGRLQVLEHALDSLIP